MIHEHFREALEQLDIELARKIWVYSMPHLPAPETAEEAEIVVHMTRTQIEQISFRARAYSHAWLIERRFPSGLPDELRPRAQRLYPVVAEAVGLAVQNRTPEALAIRRAMEEAVLDVGLKNPLTTKRAILAARERARKRFL